MKADTFTYVVLAQVQNEDGWGPNLQGIGKTPLFMFENSDSDAAFGFFSAKVSDKKIFQGSEDKWGEVINPYIENFGLKDFNEATGLSVEESYLFELMSATLNKETEESDFEFENNVSLTLLENEDLSNEEILSNHVGKFGFWIITRDGLDSSFEGDRLLIDEQEIGSLDDAVEEFLSSEGSSYLVLLDS